MSPCSVEVPVNLKVIDRSMPVFDKQFYTDSVLESIEVHSPLSLSIQAESPLNRKLIYSITRGNDFEEFALDFNTGNYTFDRIMCLGVEINEKKKSYINRRLVAIDRSKLQSTFFFFISTFPAALDGNNGPCEYSKDKTNLFFFLYAVCCTPRLSSLSHAFCFFFLSASFMFAHDCLSFPCKSTRSLAVHILTMSCCPRSISL